MSYASVAAQGVPPPEQQPHPDPNLLTTEPPSAANIADDAAKLNVVAPGFKEKPATVYSEQNPLKAASRRGSTSESGPAGNSSKKETAAEKARKYVHEAEREGSYLWDRAKHYLVRPAVAGGLLGLVNMGLVSGVGYSFYTQPHLRRDTRAISATAGAALLLLGAESYAAEKYRNTPAGREEEKRAKEEGALIYRVAREHVLRPGVLGGLVGLLNAGILGAIGYYSYINWDKPRWDRRTVSAISAALIALWSGEGYLAEQYRKKHH